MPAGSVLSLHNLTVDPQRHEVRRGDRPVELSPTEFKLLHYLITHPGQVLSKAQILEAVWQYDFGGDSVVSSGSSPTSGARWTTARSR